MAPERINEQVPVRVIGTYISPFVRKVLVVLDLKGVAYEIDPILAFHGNDEFSKLSPLRRVPVLVDDTVTVRDSTIICEYLEEKYPSPSLYPKNLADRAHARWLEEYADTRLQEVLMVHFFNNQVVKPMLWNEPPDVEILERAKTEEIPHVLDYLESELPVSGYLFGDISVADISIASFFRNMVIIGYQIDSDNWPITAAFLDRVLALDSFVKLNPLEEAIADLPLSEHREAFRRAGSPVTSDTHGTDTPRRGYVVIQ